ncbi:MAG: glycosyltransferase [Phycisphaerae bacterium]|nr:glycosyltransferase [Phycisphaerae bacterium]
MIESSSPKVLHLVYNLIRGGTEGQCARVAMEMVRLGHDHRVAVFRREGFFLEQVESLCGPVYEIGIQHMVSLDTLLRLQRLQRFQRLERFDVIHTWDMDACIFGPVAARWAGLPFIVSRRNLADVMPAYKRRLIARSSRGASAVVVNAEAIRARLIEEGVPGERITKIENMIDVAEFDRLAAGRPEGDLPDGRIVGMVARLEPEKDVATFLRAAAIVLSRSKDALFIIVGEGAERARLELLAQSLGIGARVFFLGERADVPQLIRRFEVGVLVPNANEGLSNSILEYMAGGIPVVATDCGGNRELVEGSGAGVVVRVGDAQAVADGITRFLEHPSDAAAAGKAGRAKVLRENTPDVVIPQFEALYRRVGQRNTRKDTESRRGTEGERDG